MKTKERNLIALNKIRINDSFWNKYTNLVTKEVIPYQWKALNDEVEEAEPSHCIRNFQIAAGRKDGEFQGWVFQDTDLAKWLEAVAYSLSYEKNEELEKLADGAIDLIGDAQEENGYLDTYFSILEPGKQFCNLKEGHELYTAGHFMEAAVAYYKITGKDKLLKIMERTADLICEVFHTPRYENAVPGHEEIELALVKMAEVTGKQEYLDMAKDFIERRGTEPNYLFNESKQDYFVDVWHDTSPYTNEYGQNHLPVWEQRTAEGHAVRAMYLYCGMADIAYQYQDKSLMEACENLYNNIVERRMYITGGIGSSGALERFTTDYDLPNSSNYAESCASIGLALFCRRMAQYTGEAKYVETMEVALMNTLLSGIAMDGKSFFYVNPLEVWPASCMDHTSMAHVKPIRQKWFGCACCPPNIARTLASLGEYVCFTGENAIWINLFTSGAMNTSLGNRNLQVETTTQFPWEGRFRIQLSELQEAEEQGLEIQNTKEQRKTVQELSRIYIRIPEYATNYVVKINGKEVNVPIDKGYAILEAVWINQNIELDFDMPAHYVSANPQVRADTGKVAIVKGPIVYCLEQEDNGSNLSGIFLDTRYPLQEEFQANLLGGVTVVKAKGKRIQTNNWNPQKLYAPVPMTFEDTEVTFVPYGNWGNRQPGEMSVWVKALTNSLEGL